jgi:hypothetical protein
MVEVIGLMTMTALVWVLAFMMATESDSERRHGSSQLGSERPTMDVLQTQGHTRHAA